MQTRGGWPFFEVDVTSAKVNPPDVATLAAAPALGQPGNDHVKALVPALEKLKVVDFERYINVHTSDEAQTKAELWKAAGK